MLYMHDTQTYFKITTHQGPMKRIILSTLQKDKGDWNDHSNLTFYDLTCCTEHD